MGLRAARTAVRAARRAVRAAIVVGVLLPLLPLLLWSVSFRWFFPALLPPRGGAYWL